jgi:hypothetical protein
MHHTTRVSQSMRVLGIGNTNMEYQTHGTGQAASASETEALFQLLFLTDHNKDGVIAGEQESFDRKVDINFDDQIDQVEAKYYLLTQDFPRNLRQYYALTNRDVTRLQGYFDDRLTYLDLFENEELQNRALLQTAQYMLASGYAVFQEPALNLLTQLPESHAVEATQGSYIPYFHNTYEECRAAFIAKVDTLAKQRSDLSYLSIPVASNTADDLTVDGVFIPATGEQKHCLVLISGTHGVEGFFGSAQQLYLLDQLIAGKVDSRHVGIMMIHGYNPWGFKTEMRTMEGGIDANRNHLYHTTHENLENDFYHELNPFVNPEGSFADQAAWRQGFMAKSIGRLIYYGNGNPTKGREKIRQAIMEGQNDYAGGVSDAGLDYAAQAEAMTEFYKKHTRDFNEVILMDVHSGLGTYGHVHYLSIDPNITTEQREKLSSLFGDVTFTDKESKEFYTVNGDVMGYLQRQSAPEQSVLCIAPEAGTVGLGMKHQINSMKVLIGMCQFARNDAETAADELVIRKEILGFLNPRAPNWRGPIMEQVADKFDRMFSVWETEDSR